jgi:hypothetical protein
VACALIPFVGKPERKKDHLENLAIDGRIVLK